MDGGCELGGDFAAFTRIAVVRSVFVIGSGVGVCRFRRRQQLRVRLGEFGVAAFGVDCPTDFPLTRYTSLLLAGSLVARPASVLKGRR